MEQENYKRLYRVEDGKMVFGVCAGLAEYFEVDSTIIRIIMVLLAFGGGIGVVIYIVLALIMPQKGSSVDPKETVRSNAKGAAEEIKQAATTIHQTYRSSNLASDSRLWFGLVVLFLGVFFLFQNLSIFSWLKVDILWPIFIMMIGLFLLFRRR